MSATIKTMAGIVSYMPDVKRLRENILAVLPQVDKLVIFINGQESVEGTQRATENFENIVFISSSKNQGIAYALKEIMQYAIENHFDWVLSLDQDSVCQPGLVEEYKKYINLPSAGMLTCEIVDRNSKNIDKIQSDKEYIEVEDAITSAAFTSVSAYQKTSGYNESLFIDYVDWDIVFQLRRKGYKIYRIRFYGLLHELGHTTIHKILWKKCSTFNHSPFRHYYQARNWKYLRKTYPEFLSFFKAFKIEATFQIKVLLFENRKWKKLSARWRGIKDESKI